MKKTTLPQKNIGAELDALTPEELARAAMPTTPQEKQAETFNANFPRELPWLSRHVQYLCRMHQARTSMAKIMPLEKMMREFSQATTGYWPALRIWHLSQIMRASKPRIVYEFGSGVSTILIGSWLRHNAQEFGVKGKLVSFEQSPDYYKRVQRYFPDSLREWVDVHLAPVRLDWFGPYRGLYFDFQPPERIDLAYIDGPTLPEVTRPQTPDFPRQNADLVRLHRDGCDIGMAVTDHRWPNYPFFKDMMEETHTIRCSRWYKSITVTSRKPES